MAAAPESPRVAPQRLLDTLSRHCSSRDAGRTALFVVALNRSDRLLALAQHSSNRYVLAEIARGRQKLASPDFVARAPAEIVDQQRERLEDAEATRARLQQALRRIG